MYNINTPKPTPPLNDNINNTTIYTKHYENDVVTQTTPLNSNITCTSNSAMESFRNIIINSVFFDLFFKCIFFYLTTKFIYTVIDSIPIYNCDTKLFIYGALTIIIGNTKPCNNMDYYANYDWLLTIIILTKIVSIIKKLVNKNKTKKEL